MIPKDISDELREKCDLKITDIEPVSGGCINQTFELITPKGPFFLKVNAQEPADFFRKEAAGLEELRQADTDLIIPTVLAVRDIGPDTAGYLLMDYIEEGGRGDGEVFGAQLAKLHRHSRETFGFIHDNYIGSLPQANGDAEHWIDFFCSQRIEPLLRQAIDNGQVNASIRTHWDRLTGQLNSLLPTCVPALLHGDLWSGNYLYDSKGRAVLIDPAVYYGHPEMDLAFSRMFGGFSASFYEGYASVQPLEPGFSERVDIHNLYPLLVHVNLFGGHYSNQLAAVLGRF
jgi:fructosamine-3-kinase